MKQLNEEMIGLKANTDRKLRQLKDDCKRKLAKRDRRIAVLKVSPLPELIGRA